MSPYGCANNRVNRWPRHLTQCVTGLFGHFDMSCVRLEQDARGGGENHRETDNVRHGETLAEDNC